MEKGEGLGFKSRMNKKIRCRTGGGWRATGVGWLKSR